MLIVKNLYFNIIILYTLTYILKCNKKFKILLLGAVIGSYRIFVPIVFDLLMLLLVFKNKKVILNYIIIILVLKSINYNIIISPFVLYLYKKAHVREENDMRVQIITNEENIKIKGFMDTGNMLEYFGKPIIILNIDKLKNYSIKYYVPYQTIQGSSILPIIETKKIIVNKKEIKNVLVGVTKMEGIELILNPKIMEE